MNEATSLGEWFPEHLAFQPHRGWGFTDLEDSLPPRSGQQKRKEQRDRCAVGWTWHQRRGGCQGGCHLLPSLLQVVSPTSLFTPVQWAQKQFTNMHCWARWDLLLLAGTLQGACHIQSPT